MKTLYLALTCVLFFTSSVYALNPYPCTSLPPSSITPTLPYVEIVSVETRTPGAESFVPMAAHDACIGFSTNGAADMDKDYRPFTITFFNPAGGFFGPAAPAGTRYRVTLKFTPDFKNFRWGFISAKGDNATALRSQSKPAEITVEVESVTSGIWSGEQASECKTATVQTHNTLSIFFGTFNKKVMEGPIDNHYFENFSRVLMMGRSRTDGVTMELKGTVLQTEASICAEPDDPKPDATLKIFIPNQLFVYSGSNIPLYTDVLSKISDDVLRLMFAVNELSSDKEFVSFDAKKTYGEYVNGGVKKGTKSDGVLFTLAVNKKGAAANVAAAALVAASSRREKIGLTKAAQKALRECVRGKKLPKGRKILKKGSKSVRCKK